MSELRLQLKKAISIIVVTWILSMVTTLASVYVVVPNILRPTWHEVAEFAQEYEDYNRETTNVFYVPSNHWKMEWTVMPDQYPASEDTWFAFYLDSEDYATFTQCTVTPADFEWDSLGWSGTKYITGSGQFSIIVAGKNVLWGITVEAYY